ATGPVLLITDASLGQITAAALVLDTTGAADIFVNGVGLHPTLNGVTLNSGSDVTFDTTGSSFASSLTANGSGITVAGNLSVGTTLALDASAAISQTGGAVTAGNAVFDAGTGISQSAGTLAAASVTLEAGTTISQTNGRISTGVLSGSSHGDATLTGNNAIDTLNGFDTNGHAFTLADGSALTVAALLATESGTVTISDASTLTVAGSISSAGGNQSLSGTSLALDGKIDAGAGRATLTATAGGITETGIITAATLTGSSHGDVTLTGNNAISTLNGFDTNGHAFTLADGSALTVAALLATESGAVTINDSSTLTVVGAINSAGGNQSLSGTNLALGGSLNAGDGQVSLTATA